MGRSHVHLAMEGLLLSIVSVFCFLTVFSAATASSEGIHGGDQPLTTIKASPRILGQNDEDPEWAVELSKDDWVEVFSPAKFKTIVAKSIKANRPPFEYKEETGRGPSNWGKLYPDWKACSNGKLQSPIDIDDQHVEVLPCLGELNLQYKPAPAVLRNRGFDIAVEWQGDPGNLVIDGTPYKLHNFHWHSPSEHTFKGTTHDLELHIVHKSLVGGTAVIGVLYSIGSPEPFLERLLPYIKTTKPEESKDLKIVNPGDLINFGSEKYYRYTGSLTTPPCSEGVIWSVVQRVRTASKEQIDALRNAVVHGFEANARPIQDRHGRPIYLYSPLIVEI